MSENIEKINPKEIIDLVKKEIVNQLPNKCITDGLIGKALGINERTLQRRLKEQGTTFYALFNEVRLELVKKYTKDRSLSLSDISDLLGYSNMSSFSRAYKELTGLPPSSLRSKK